MLNARFTLCFKDVLTLHPNVLDNLIMDTQEHTDKLKDMLKAKWGIYEISGETVPEFKLFLENKFNEYKDYYIEMINAYETQLRWLDGNINVETYDLAETDDEKYTPKVTVTTTDTPGVVMQDENYDLPRSTTSENRPSSKSVSTPTGYDTRVVEPDGENSNDTDRDKTKTGTVTTTSGDQIAQREKYLKSIRSLYAEFAEKFKACFLDMYW